MTAFRNPAHPSPDLTIWKARAELGISDGFIRFSAGLEHPDDLIEDILKALDKA
jgi:cystathionine beta-lyase/cystathionine gamma-synthase